MKVIMAVFLFLLATFALSQEKNSVRIGFRVFKEADGPFQFKRQLPKSDYVYNEGIGARIKYLRTLSNRLSTGIETGFWYFWNNSESLDFNRGSYVKRNTVLPLLAVLHVSVFRKNLNWISIGMKGGMAYVQNVRIFSTKTGQMKASWMGLAEISLTAQLFTKRKRVYHFGYGCDFFDERFLRSLYFDFKKLSF